MNERIDLPLTSLDYRPGLRRGLVSLPLPRDAAAGIAVDGCACQAVPVGYWPRSEATAGGPRRARRALVYFAAPDGVPQRPTLSLGPGAAAAEANGAGTGWEVQLEVVEKHDLHSDAQGWHYCKEINELRLAYGGRAAGLRLGIKNGWGLHQWQFLAVDRLWSGPLCAAYLVGGHIYTGWDHRVTGEEMQYRHQQRGSLPLDETVAASLYLVLHSDGSAQVTAHFVNGRVYHGAGPTIGQPVILISGAAEAVEEAGRAWDGGEGSLHANGLTVNLAPAAHLACAERPGRLWRETAGAPLLAWRPFESTRIDLRTAPGPDGAPVETEVEGSREGLPKGAARSIPFGLSLSGAPSDVQRYLAPPEWYARNEELAPMPLVHRRGRWTEVSAAGAAALRENSIHGRFTAGAIYRYLYQHGKGTYEISMDGNESRSLYRFAYWTGDEPSYALAERNAAFCADIAVDHSRDIVHYHGDQEHWDVYSLIYMRFSGLVYAYLEQGDPYYLRTAQAVAQTYINQHRANWPRRGMGRDLDPLAGICILYDYTGDEHWLDFAREVAGNVATVIGEEGQWLCGSGVGPYWGVNALVGGPWNGGHFFHGFSEYAMRAETIPQAWVEPARRALRRLLTELWETPHHFHPASCGFLPRLHWYLACRLGDAELIELVQRLMDALWSYWNDPKEDPLFHGGKAHHMNNYLDYLLFFEATHDTLPQRATLDKQALRRT